MEYKIISDSSSDLTELEGVPFECVPLKIITAEKEYTDNHTLDVHKMIGELEAYKGRSSSSCPNPGEWKTAFGDADNIFCVTITSGLSGSCNCARIACNEYVEENSGKNAFVVDTLSTGPESALIIEKIKELIGQKIKFEEIKEKIAEYQRRTHLIFSLDSMHNLANNGRVSPIVAKLAGVLGIRVVGKASNDGVLEITDKPRGLQKTVSTIVDNMKKNGCTDGRIKIHHCENPDALSLLKKAISEAFPKATIETAITRGLCSFYAERGGLLIGYEGDPKF